MIHHITNTNGKITPQTKVVIMMSDPRQMILSSCVITLLSILITYYMSYMPFSLCHSTDFTFTVETYHTSDDLIFSGHTIKLSGRRSLSILLRALATASCANLPLSIDA